MRNPVLSTARLALCSFLLAAGLQAMPVAAADEPQHGQHPQEPLDETGYPYQLFIPRGLEAGDDGEQTKWPLMIFLHGSGERGDDVARVKVHGPPKHADRNPDFPFILISPLLGAEQDWDIAKLDKILDHVTATLPVDPDRIYLTGLSRGGHAAWRWAAAEPERFAALAPVAGRGVADTACALKDLPVWAFHGDRDDVVVPEGSFAMARAIRACEGRKSRLTIYPDLGHNAWDPAYEDPELYLWLLSQRRMQGGE
ncbi:carboxylesterase family protein [Allopontixanthobacter sediminis]|uniref:Phospholipase n=1 Tax=Allopontixanthobacter sediminis TaxID=1689985 RepID=A0A845B2V4_9SPHN|nr:phospholipase [Allopontixanthobacter sediminis]MXP45581.1 phospholipase [Allopontixanthobacter sediminis]